MQNNEIYNEWLLKKQKGIKSLAVLIDPDKASKTHLNSLCKKANEKMLCAFSKSSISIKTSRTLSLPTVMHVWCCFHPRTVLRTG